MARIALAVATLLLAGCAAREPVAIVTDTGYSGDNLACWLGINNDTDLLLADPKYGTVLEHENGTLSAAKWPPNYTARRAGSEVEVMDGHGNVVAITGRRYRIDWVSLPADFDDSQPPAGEWPRPFGQVICGARPA